MSSRPAKPSRPSVRAKRRAFDGKKPLVALAVATAGLFALALALGFFGDAAGLDLRVWVVLVPIAFLTVTVAYAVAYCCVLLYKKSGVLLALAGGALAVIAACAILVLPWMFASLLPEERMAPDGNIQRVSHFLWGASPYLAQPVGSFFMREIDESPSQSSLVEDTAQQEPRKEPMNEPQDEDAPVLSNEEELAAAGCIYQVTGTVTSSPSDTPFEFRVDDGNGVLEDGSTVLVSRERIKKRLYGMKGLQWGMDGVVIGFADVPGDDGVLQALVIVGNDDTSSAYWESVG